MTSQGDIPLDEMTTKELRALIKQSNRVLDSIERADPASVTREGKADALLARGEIALATVQEAERELRDREQRSFPERLRLGRALRDAKRTEHPAARWFDKASKFSAPEAQGERLLAHRLTDSDAAELERLVRRKGDILTNEHAPPWSEEETAALLRPGSARPTLATLARRAASGEH